MIPGSDRPWGWITDLALGVIGTILSVLTLLGVKGTRDLLRDVETSKIQLKELEKRIDRMEDRL